LKHFDQVLKELYDKALPMYGTKTAIKFAGQDVTYDDLNRQSNQLAQAFTHSGISVEVPVALILSNSIEYVVSDLAIMKAGAVKVPLNDMLGEKEILYMLENSEAKAAIVGPNFYAMLSNIRHHLPLLEVVIGVTESVPDGFLTLNEFIAGEPETTPNVDVKPYHRATISYTGGTTGLSKGIVQSQQNLVMNLYCHLLELEIVEEDKILLMTPLPHSAGKFVETGLLKGATHIIGDKFDPLQALRFMQEESITVTFMVPTMIYRLLDSIDMIHFDPSTTKIKMIAYAAAPITAERLKQGLKKFGPVFYQFYGQSECPNFITRLKKSDHSLDPDKSHRLRSCGSPSFMSKVKIVDEEGKERSYGEQGEIIVNAPFVMERYHNLPEKTAETIVNDWLHTGDIGKMDEDGYVYLLDRKNDMIVSGGMNVYSTEVENVIQQYPGVRQVAVIGIPHHDWGEQVMVLVIPDIDNPPSEEGIRQFCKQNLAKYKQPKEIEFVSDFPLTTYGKLDKKLLRKPYWQGAERSIN
jgi:fatty-acyl-CoA synthase